MRLEYSCPCYLTESFIINTVFPPSYTAAQVIALFLATLFFVPSATPDYPLSSSDLKHFQGALLPLLPLCSRPSLSSHLCLLPRSDRYKALVPHQHQGRGEDKGHQGDMKHTEGEWMRLVVSCSFLSRALCCRPYCPEPPAVSSFSARTFRWR